MSERLVIQDYVNLVTEFINSTYRVFDVNDVYAYCRQQIGKTGYEADFEMRKNVDKTLNYLSTTSYLSRSSTTYTRLKTIKPSSKLIMEADFNNTVKPSKSRIQKLNEMDKRVKYKHSTQVLHDIKSRQQINETEFLK